MKTNLKFSTLFLACGLVLTGCWGGGSSNNANNNTASNNTASNNTANNNTANNNTANNNTTNVNNSATCSSTPPLQQAKDFIKTSNNIFANAQTIFATYQPADLVGTEELSGATDVVSGLAQHAYDLANGGSLTLSTSQIQTYLSRRESSKFTGLEGLNVSITAGKATINGTFTQQLLTDYRYDRVTQTVTPIYGSTATINVSNFSAEAPISTTSSTSYTLQLNANSSISTTTNGQTATLTAGTNSTITFTYPTADSAQIRLNTDEFPASVKLELKNISIASGTGASATKLSLDQLSLTGQKVQYIASDKVLQTLFVPTSIVFKGSASQGANTAAISATFNLTNDLSKVIDLSGTAKPRESSTNFRQGNFTLDVKTTIQTGTQSNVLTAVFKGNRTTYGQAQLSNIELSVNNDKLTGTANYTFANGTQPETLDVTLNTPSNCASTNIKNILSIDAAPVGTKVSDITVNGTVQGTISKTSSSVYQAKFIDNMIVVIAP